MPLDLDKTPNASRARMLYSARTFTPDDAVRVAELAVRLAHHRPLLGAPVIAQTAAEWVLWCEMHRLALRALRRIEATGEGGPDGRLRDDAYAAAGRVDMLAAAFREETALWGVRSFVFLDPDLSTFAVRFPESEGHVYV